MFQLILIHMLIHIYVNYNKTAFHDWQIKTLKNEQHDFQSPHCDQPLLSRSVLFRGC